MRTTNIAGCCLTLLLVPTATILASDGATPIWEPTTIVESGKYVLTRDYGDESGATAIVINADNVSLDLNGFTVESNQYTIECYGDGVKIYNGTVINGDEQALTVWGDNFDVRDITFVTEHDDSTVGLHGNNGLFENNVIAAAPGAAVGFGLAVNGAGITVRNNVIRNFEHGISVAGHGNQILRNTISTCVHGIYVWGDLNVIEGNVINSHSSYGMYFGLESANNVYRGNTARGNNGSDCTGTASGGDFCDEGTNNTSHGDNYMPGRM